MPERDRECGSDEWLGEAVLSVSQANPCGRVERATIVASRKVIASRNLNQLQGNGNPTNDAD